MRHLNWIQLLTGFVVGLSWWACGFVVGRPGLDPGTLGLKERVRSSVQCSYVHCSSSFWV